MTQQNLVTVVLVVAGAVIPYLISQQDVPLPPIVIVALTALNIGLLAYARLSNGGAPVTTITTTAPTSVTTTTENIPPPV